MMYEKSNLTFNRYRLIFWRSIYPTRDRRGFNGNDFVWNCDDCHRRFSLYTQLDRLKNRPQTGSGEKKYDKKPHRKTKSISLKNADNTRGKPVKFYV